MKAAAALAVGDLAEVADDAPDRRLVELVRPGGLDPAPLDAVEHAELCGDRSVGVLDQAAGTTAKDCSIPAVVEVFDEAAADDVRLVPRKIASTAGLMYLTRPDGVTTVMMSVACWTKARKRASLSPSTTRACSTRSRAG